MTARWRYTAAQTETRNVARIGSISFRFGERPVVVIEYEIGDDTGGDFVVKNRGHLEMDQPLPAAVTTLMDNINTRALAFLVARGIIPAGAEETPPAAPSR
jgi:hypothetical protein